VNDSDDSLQPPPSTRNRRTAILRIASAFGVALAFSLSIYTLIAVTQPSEGLVGFSFLLVLPAVLSAFVAYVADPWAERPLRFYLLIPFWIILAVMVISGPLLKEGVICILMLSPLWMVSGMIGTGIAWKVRNRVNRGKTYCAALLALPLLAMQVEPHIPIPVSHASVSRSIIVNASPQRLWPLLEGVPDVQPTEGRWTIAHNLIRLPRPVGAHLAGSGIGADRHAEWSGHIRFRESITRWEPGRHIGWAFHFDDKSGWDITDHHLMPDGPHMVIESGGYSMEPLAPGRTRLTLETRYRMHSLLSGYAALWGELFLGDLENNVLTIIRDRAERR